MICMQHSEQKDLNRIDIFSYRFYLLDNQRLFFMNVLRFFLFATLLSLSACIDLYDKKYKYDTNLVFVEALLTDQDPFVVTIAQSRSIQLTEYQQPISRAIVELLIGDGSKITLTESTTKAGTYQAPATFRGKIGQSYRLRMRFSDNRIYESSLERLHASPSILKTYTTFNQKGIADNNGVQIASSMDVFIDTQDAESEQNFYQWRTYLYENQRVCASCANGQWNARNNECQFYRLDPPPLPPYINDYECDRRCWQVYTDERYNVFSDALTNGRPITRRLVKQVPFYEENLPGALLIIHQLSITSTMYRYFNIIKQQSETTGSLADVPPAPPVGNIRNINNSEEAVIGYFAAAGITKTTFWVERLSATGAKTTTMLGGRQRVVDSNDPFTSLPKGFKVTCGALKGQTPVAPEGWRF